MGIFEIARKCFAVLFHFLVLLETVSKSSEKVCHFVIFYLESLNLKLIGK